MLLYEAPFYGVTQPKRFINLFSTQQHFCFYVHFLPTGGLFAKPDRRVAEP
jgi:hypothetical protein